MFPQGEVYSHYSSIKMGFGTVRNGGTNSDSRITFDADPSGLAGASPLVVSFSLPSGTLGEQDPENVVFALSFRSASRQTARLTSKFGLFLHIFEARLMDTSAVFVVPEEPRGSRYRFDNIPTPA